MRPGGIILGLLAVWVSVFGYFSLPLAQAKTRVEVSIFYPGSAWNISTLNTFQSSLGVKFSSAKWYSDWATPFDTSAANTFHSNGYIPEMTWEPSLSGTGVAYNDVINGDYDSYIVSTANAVKSLGYTIRISLAPEMNTDWTPWGIGKQGNNASNHKLFWRHVVQKFRDAGANNVKWIWSPNVKPWNAQTLYGSYANIFPGSSYVDYMGLDGYNWGKSQSWSTWQSFKEVFASSYNELVGVSSKDILIMEMASTEIGGNKAAWITDLFNQLDNGFGRIKGFTWFHINKETDWRINSSTAAMLAFTNGYLGKPAPTTSSGPVAGNSNDSTSTTNSRSSNTGAPPNTSSATQTPTAPTTSNKNTGTKRSLILAPKIAGATIFDNPEPVLDMSEKMGIMTSMLLGGTMMAGLFVRRFRLIHLHHYPAAERVGHNMIDSVFHPMSHRHRHTAKRLNRTIR